MSYRILFPKVIAAFILCSLLVSCTTSTDTNYDSGPGNVVQGSGSNHVDNGVNGGTISGGGMSTFPNQILRDFGVIGGGRGNSAGSFSTVSGGDANNAEGVRATIGGGEHNTASRNNTVVAGGALNTASQSYATVGGGNVNTADGSYTTVAGGAGNLATGRVSTVSGGTHNETQSAYATIGGGSFNLAIGGTSTISGGTYNHTPGIGSSIGGGAGNDADGLESVISGGLSNQVNDNYSTVAGGRQNIAGNGNGDPEDAPYTSVGGGYGNQAGGAYSTVSGGYGNQALGDYSFAAGNQAQVSSAHSGTFLFADGSNFAFLSSSANEFAVRATGGVRFVTGLDASGSPLIGVRLAPGSGTWETLSDRKAKTSILPVDTQQVLNTLMTVPVSTWSYIGQSNSVRHIGPMAQDFYAAFGTGEDGHYIGAVDADGVALASIQGLYQVVQEKDAHISSLQAQNADQEQRLTELEKRVIELENRNGGLALRANNSWPVILALVVGLILERYFLVNRKAL